MSDEGHCTDIINLRYPEGSLGSASNPEQFNHQDYEQLKQTYLRRGRLFVDNTFPPNINSLGELKLKTVSVHDVEWLRPKDIMKRNRLSEEPSFFLDGASRFDFTQGSVGNCWFLAAALSLTFKKDILVQVVPSNQDFNNYAGIFHFRFWRFGKWVDVVIDDFLPVYWNNTLFAKSKSGKEFWALLLEKAYAKVCGSYGDMRFGNPVEAFKDFCGGVSMIYDLKDASHNVELWGSLTRATECKSMICCGTAQNKITNANSVSHTGLVDGHAYSVTGVTEVDVYGSKVKLVRVMNPWGRTEWNQAWSDGSSKWDSVSSEDRSRCLKREDGEFWIELEDFCHCFLYMTISCENPNFLDGDVTCQWKCMIHDGRWQAGTSAGGSAGNATFWKNPQFRLKVKEINRQEKEDKNVLVSLLQKPDEKNRKQRELNPIGVSVYEVPSGTPNRRLDSNFFYGKRSLKQPQVYTWNRELIEIYSLQPGEYVIVASTTQPNMSGEFVLSVYTKADSDMTDHSHHDDEDEDDHVDIPKPTDREDDKSSTSEIFRRYADQNGELGDRQLQKLLSNTFANGSYFDLDSCRSMIAAVDTQRSGKMTYTEFLSLWNKFEEYKKIFKRADVNQTGTLSSGELQNAVRAAGMDVDNALVHLMLIRFTGNNANISLESFLAFMLRMDNASHVFKTKSKDGVMYVDWNDWSKLMYF